ncbi:MAG TPA: DUF1292 domain-containing protein [Proteiniclasticum sp.]|jgi:uncharacterized protein YrzB (UPF0473 family)|nr:DUF1292 domain-containing protein [Proteiniclasticum sp.]
MEDMTDLIVLTDEDGNEVEVEVVTRMEIEDVEYFIVSPVDSDEEEPIFTAMKVVYDEEGNEFFETVDDDVEIAMIEEAYSVMFDEDGLN